MICDLSGFFSIVLQHHVLYEAFTLIWKICSVSNSGGIACLTSQINVDRHK